MKPRTWTKELGLRRVPTVTILDEKRQVVYLREVYPGNDKLEKALRANNNKTE